MFKVYVGNLDLRVTADTLRPLFEPFGDLDEIIVAADPKSNKPRGFAIVLFRDPLKGQLAIETLAGRKVNGRTIIINEALKKGKAPTPAPGNAPRQGPFGPRFGSARGGVGARRFSNRNPRRGSAGMGGTGPSGPRGASSAGGPASAPGAAGETGAGVPAGSPSRSPGSPSPSRPLGEPTEPAKPLVPPPRPPRTPEPPPRS